MTAGGYGRADMYNQTALRPVERDASLLTLLMQSMNQFPLGGIEAFNIIEP